MNVKRSSYILRVGLLTYGDRGWQLVISMYSTSIIILLYVDITIDF